MSTSRLLKRVPSASFKCVGILPGHELRFHKRSTDGSSKADAFRTGTSDDVVWGVVFELADSDLMKLDSAEGVGHGYERLAVYISIVDSCGISGEEVQVWTYLVTQSVIDPALRPYTWYKNYVVEGAKEHGLPLLDNVMCRGNNEAN